MSLKPRWWGFPLIVPQWMCKALDRIGIFPKGMYLSDYAADLLVAFVRIERRKGQPGATLEEAVQEVEQMRHEGLAYTTGDIP